MRTADLPYNSELRRYEESFVNTDKQHTESMRQARGYAGGAWGTRDWLRSISSCTCSNDPEAVQIAAGDWTERLEAAYPSDAALPPVAEAAPTDARIAKLEAFEAKVLPLPLASTAPTSSAYRLRSLGGYRPECPEQPIPGLPKLCPSPVALARISRHMGAAQGSKLLIEELPPGPEGDEWRDMSWGRYTPDLPTLSRRHDELRAADT